MSRWTVRDECERCLTPDRSRGDSGLAGRRIGRMDAWLAARADGLAAASGIDRGQLELDDADAHALLELARIAAHESGQRTNAPLLCYLVGRAQAAGSDLEELVAAVRASTS